VFGVMLGGRTGYALFYETSLLNPLEFIKLWKGGLAFHGGLGGVGVAMWLFSRKHRLPWLRIVDACAIAVTPGIFAVRLANFINGELYGRPTAKDTAFAMQFPTDPVAKQLLGIPPGASMRDIELCIQVAYGKLDLASAKPSLTPTDAMNRPIDWDQIGRGLDWDRVRGLLDGKGEALVPYRHPSQIYEGLGEGLLLGLVLAGLYLVTRHRPLRPGRYAVVFLLGYAVIRGSLELVRQPDEQLGPNVALGMTMGQLLSGGLVLLAITMVVVQLRRPVAQA
jgi:phosphatidylglycerol:prolipoprotein diacylglycerol transferase